MSKQDERERRFLPAKLHRDGDEPAAKMFDKDAVRKAQRDRDIVPDLDLSIDFEEPPVPGATYIDLSEMVVVVRKFGSKAEHDREATEDSSWGRTSTRARSTRKLSSHVPAIIDAAFVRHPVIPVPPPIEGEDFPIVPTTVDLDPAHSNSLEDALADLRFVWEGRRPR